MTTTQPHHYTIMRSSFIKSRLDTIESTLYVLMHAAKKDAEPIELSHALCLVIDGVNDAKELIDELIDELQKPKR